MRIERQIAFWVAAFLVFVGLLWLLHHILLPFVVGAALAYLLDPLANRLAKRGVSRLVAALLILGGFVLVFVGLFVVVVPVLASQFSAFIEHLPGYVQRLQTLVSDPSRPWLHEIFGNAPGSDWSFGVLLNKFAGYMTEALPSLLTKGEALLSVLSLLVITPVVAFYLLSDWDRVVNSFDGLIPVKQRETVRGLARQIDMAISGYLHGQLIVCVILGCYYAFGLTMVGLSFGLLIGAVSGLLTFVPYVGSLTALVVSTGVALRGVFSGLEADCRCRRRRAFRPVSRGQCSVAKARGSKRRLASGLAHFRAADFRLPCSVLSVCSSLYPSQPLPAY